MNCFSGLEHIVRESEPMAGWCWLRLGGTADYFAEPTTVDELRAVLVAATQAALPVRILGSGSNILIRERVPGVVIHLSAPNFCGIQIDGQEIVAAGGAKLNHVVASAAREGLSGLEALVGIPGTIGGAVRGNAIGHGAAIGQWTQSVQGLNFAGEEIELSRDELRFGYGQSNLAERVILKVTLKMEFGDAATITRQMQKLWIVKRSQQPAGELGQGRIFADPRGMTASEIIEQAGLKGTNVGNASISDRNANFIETRPGTTSDEVLALVSQVQSFVATRLGVDLVPVIEVW